MNSIFGTSGIRRVFQNYSESELMFTPQMALDVGLSLGTYLKGHGTVVIGKDIRMSALPIEYALISGIISTGCNVQTIGIVTMNPAIGPAAPISNNAFLLEIGSRILMNAPIVPKIKGGGSGMKYGNDALIL